VPLPLAAVRARAKAAIVLALLFVTLPFVVRAVQPVLMELDREMEEASASLGASEATTFRRVILANLDAGHPERRGAELRPGRRGVWSIVAVAGAQRDTQVLDVHLQPDRDRQHRERGRGERRAARRLASDPPGGSV